MKNAISRNCSGLTWIEVLVALFIICVLAALAFPAFTSHRGTRVGTQTLSNMKQLHLATQSMALDGETTGGKSLGWPGDIGGTFTNWARQLVPAYLGSNDFCKLLSAPGVRVPVDEFPTSMSQGAVLVYAVSSNSSGQVVILTTANFTNSPTGGAPLQSSAKPYGKKGFVVFRKGGDGAILLSNQTNNTNLIGAYAPLCR